MADGWVCPECGLDYDTIAPGDTVVAVRSYPRRFRAALATIDDQDDPDALVRRKPDPETWSALTYTAHVAEVLAFTTDAADRILTSDSPEVEVPDGDPEAADADREEVLARLQQEADRLGARLGEARGEDWNRTGRFPWGERDLLTTARNAVHEGHHHLRDVERVLDAVRGRPSPT